jgi:hypothetical protein
MHAGAATMIRLLETDHLNDQLAGSRGCESSALFSRNELRW